MLWVCIEPQAAQSQEIVLSDVVNSFAGSNDVHGILGAVVILTTKARGQTG